MIATDDENIRAGLGQPVQKIVKQFHGFGGRNGFVINIPGDQHAVRCFALNNGKDLLQNVALIRNHEIH